MAAADRYAGLDADGALATAGVRRGPTAARGPRPLPSPEDAQRELATLAQRLANQRPRVLEGEEAAEAEQLTVVAGYRVEWLAEEVARLRAVKLADLAALARKAPDADAAVTAAKAKVREVCATECMAREGKHSLGCARAGRDLDLALADAQGPRGARRDFVKLSVPHAVHAAESAARWALLAARRLADEARAAAAGKGPDSGEARVLAARRDAVARAERVHAEAVAARARAEDEALTALATYAAPAPKTTKRKGK